MTLELDIPVDWHLISDKIRHVPQYSGNVSINKIYIAPKTLRPLCLFVRTYRLAEVKELIRSYDLATIPLFEGAWITVDDSAKRLVVPPIVEQHKDQFVIIDGLHRIYECIQQKRSKICIALIRGELDQLPGDVLDWSDVKITDQKLPREQKFRNFLSSKFRPINEYIDEFH